MENIIKRKTLEVQQFSQELIGPLASMVHKLEGEGTYTLEILAGKNSIVRSEIICSKEFKKTSEAIDLSQAVKKRAVKSIRLNNKDSYIAFYDSEKFSSFKAVIKKGRKVVFDSLNPSVGDCYSVNLLRPGKYTFKSKTLKSSFTINVQYPNLSDNDRNRFKESLKLTAKSIANKKEINVLPNQGIVFIFDEKFNDLSILFKKANLPPKGRSIRNQLKLQARQLVKKNAKGKRRVIKKFQKVHK